MTSRRRGEKVADEMVQALLPLRGALRIRALREAEGLRTAAENDVQAELVRARAEVEGMLIKAREEGRREAAAAADARRAGDRRRARTVVLAARRAAYEQLCRSARERVSRETGEQAAPGTDWSLDELAVQAVADLGTRVEGLWAP